ncbi:TPA: hypothetical protein N2R15_000546 [Citrobacter amalonaticus]|nr:hypothetical protein [Citrobacter amalonaticus]
MPNRYLNALYYVSILLCVIFPLALYHHNNNVQWEYKTANSRDDIRFSIDVCDDKDGILTVKGWAFPANGIDAKLIRLFVESDAGVYPVYKRTLRSPKVKELFGHNKLYGMVGFYGSKAINKNNKKINIIISVVDAEGSVHETKHKCN